jgi:hypothetical protein
MKSNTSGPGRTMSALRFREAVQRLGLTQAEAGVFFGRAAKTGHYWANGGNVPPSLSMLLYLIEWLEMGPAELESILTQMTKREK